MDGVGNLVSTGNVLSEKSSTETILGVVGLGNGICLVLEGLDDNKRTEDLLADDGLRPADAADDRGREEEAALGQGAVRLVDAAALLKR